jgi:outer membrane protein assembly factor BamB
MAIRGPARRRRSRRWARARARRRARLAVPRSPLVRRVLLAVVLLAVVLFPVPGLAAGGQSPQPGCHGCHPQPAAVEDWSAALTGPWTAGDSAAGTVPAGGQAYVAVGGGVAVVGNGLSLTGFGASDGTLLWQATLDAPIGSAIMSVRAWPGVITAGVLAANGQTRTEVVIDAETGQQLRQYPAALFGGAVAASAATTVVVGATYVTSYSNATGRVRWRRPIGAGQSWRADGDTLYVAQAAGGYLGSSPVTALEVINLQTGFERALGSPLGNPFSGTLTLAADGAVLFASDDGVTAYSGSTGGELWSMPSVVPEGTDPVANLIYLTSSDGTLTGVDPLTGAVKASVAGSTAGGAAGMYVVRAGVALGLDIGADGQAWGLRVASDRVTWTSPQLPWPHFFSDLSGLGGSADVSGDDVDEVVVTACPHLAATGDVCADPELVAFTL